MANIISDETIEYVGILSKEQAKKDMGSMLDYIDKSWIRQGLSRCLMCSLYRMYFVKMW